MIDLTTYFELKISQTEAELELFGAKITTCQDVEELHSLHYQKAHLDGKVAALYETWRELAGLMDTKEEKHPL